MALDVGSTIAPYSVTAKIGEGDMGEVYRARDTAAPSEPRLGRACRKPSRKTLIDLRGRARFARSFTIVCTVLLATEVVIAQRSFLSRSPTCGQIGGQTQPDLENVRTFCEAVPRDEAIGAYATESRLWVQVSRPLANQMRADHLRAEHLVLTWMRGWRQQSGFQSVTVTVKWGDIRIAKGQTTQSHGDQVTVP